jgi:uncharacterized glyoxalase superfamily protein PhnB
MAKKSKKATRKTAKAAPKKAVKKAAKKAAAQNTATRKVPTKKAVTKAAPRSRGSALVSIAAGFTANDAAATIKWYCDVLGFKVLERWEHEGRFLGAQIGSGGVVINVGQDDWKQGRDRIKGQGARLYILMGPDVDGFATAIKARGGTLADEPRTEWGMRAFSINDPDGFKLTFMYELPK